MNEYKDVFADGEHRVAHVKDGHWVSISAEVTCLGRRGHEHAPYGEQCPGHWITGDVIDANTGEVYHRA